MKGESRPRQVRLPLCSVLHRAAVAACSKDGNGRDTLSVRVRDEPPELAEVPADEIDQVHAHVAHRAVAGDGAVHAPGRRERLVRHPAAEPPGRDVKDAAGRALVALYEEVGPTAADFIRDRELFRAAARAALAPLIALCGLLD